MTAPLSSRTRFTLAAVLIAMAGTLLVYGGTIDVGLYYDDYHFARPWSALELRRVWYGSWDPSGIESAFYRPLTAAWFAARFWLFGVNPIAMHAVSVAGHLLCSVLVAWLLRREGVASGIALLGAWLYAIHPTLPYAQVSWLTNQMHLSESLVVLAALLYWQRVRDRPLIHWVPLAALAPIAFLIKEDGIMLLPAIVVLTLVRSRNLRTLPRKNLLWLGVTASVIAAALMAFRYARLGRMGGYGTPALDVAFWNFWKGLKAAVLLWPTRTPWQGVASLMAMAALIFALGVGRWRPNRRALFVLGSALVIALSFNLPSLFFDRPYPLLTWQALASGVALSMLAVGSGAAMWSNNRRAIFLIAAGMAVAFSFDAPFLLVSKREQYHLLALGAVVAYAGAANGLADAAGAGARYVLVSILLLSVTLGLLARSQAADFLPCAPTVLSQDAEVRGWWVVPPEIKAWLETKAKNCEAGRAPGRVSALPVVSWGVYDEQRDESGAPYRWTNDHSVLLAGGETASLTLAVRQPQATAVQPVHVTVVGGERPTVVTLDSGEWRFATLRFPRSALAWLRAGRRVDLIVDRWFVPAVLDPTSSDLRRFGVEVRVVGAQ